MENPESLAEAEFPLEALHEPPTLTPERARAVFDEASEILEGSGREEYLLRAVGWGRADGELHRFESSARLFRETLENFSQQSGKTFGEMIEGLAINDPPHFMNLFHWLWFFGKAPWMIQKYFPEREKQKMIRKIDAGLEKLFRTNPGFVSLANQIEGIIVDTLFSAVKHQNSIEARMDTKQAELHIHEQQAMTGHAFAGLCEIFDISPEEIQTWIDSGAEVLDLGCGISDFTLQLRRRGVQAFSLDLKPFDLLYAPSHNRLFLRHDEEEGFCNAERFQEAEKTMLKRAHYQGQAKNTASLCGKDRFQKVISHFSITQPGYSCYSEVFRNTPILLWENIVGVLPSLKKEGGQFLVAPLMEFNYPVMMKKITAMIVALLAGQFELMGCHDPSGNFSFREFVERQVFGASQGAHGRTGGLKIRRHPVSDPDRANRVAMAMLGKNLSPEKAVLIQ